LQQNLWLQKQVPAFPGFSDGYIKAGTGDDYLIQDDKAANRAGLTLLEIDTTKSSFESDVAEADLVINFNNDLSLSYDETELKKIFENTKVIACATHETVFTALANLIIPVSSYSEYAGSVINCDNILQRFPKAVTKNTELPDIMQIAAQLGGTLRTPVEAFTELQQVIGALKEYQPTGIPVEGLNLNDSEAA